MGALAEEMEMIREEGRAEGFAEGFAEVLAEEHERLLSNAVEFYSQLFVKIRSETGKSAEEVISDLHILPEFRDEVLACLMELEDRTA